MCEFVSWIELKGKEYFLTNADLETKAGKLLFKPDVISDLCGHGAILAYYPELKDKGVKRECTDFSTQKNFPKSIAKAIKRGKLSSIGICLDVLNDKGKKQYQKVKDTAWAEYRKVEGPAWAEYQKVKDTALAEYQKVEGPAWAEYQKVEGPALAEYQKVKDTALAEYEKVEGPAFSKIIRQTKYRNNNWK